VTVAVQSLMDLQGNILLKEHVWSFIAKPQACGRAELKASNINEWLVVNSKTVLASNKLAVAIFNPDQDLPAWELNPRVQAVNLLYRAKGAKAWLPAQSGGQAAVFDISVCAG
jgi:hypothetical protein